MLVHLVSGMWWVATGFQPGVKDDSSCCPPVSSSKRHVDAISKGVGILISKKMSLSVDG